MTRLLCGACGALLLAGCANWTPEQRANFSARLGAAGRIMSQQPGGYAPAPASPANSMMSLGVLRGESIEGTSRICVYDRMGSPNVITMPATTLCPI